jgi:hypothetical protein
MAGEISIKGKKAPKGEKMTKGTGWRLAATSGRKRVRCNPASDHQHGK